MISIDSVRNSFQLNRFTNELENLPYKIKHAAKEIVAKSKLSGKFGSYQSKAISFAVNVAVVEDVAEDADPMEMEIDAVNASFKDALKDEETRVSSTPLLIMNRMI
jgi:hypothetical protein